MAAQTLLTYELGWTPTPVLANAPVALSVTADNTSGRQVELASVAIVVPLGANADDLAATIDGGGSVPPDGWSAAHTTGSGTITFTPTNGKPVVVRGQSLTFGLPAIEVNAQPGTTTPIRVIETTVPRSGPAVTRTYSEPVNKFPAGFSLSDLTADPQTPVDYGGDVTLRWSGSAGPAYTMQRSDQPNDPPASVGNAGPLLEHSLTESPFVVFTLSATVTVPNQDPLAYTKQCIVTVLQPPPAIQRFSAEVTISGRRAQLTASWSVAHVADCEVAELAGSLFPSEHTQTLQPTADQPLPTRLSLTATNAAGSVSRTLYLQWAAPVTVEVDEGMDMALSPDGERIYAAVDTAGLQVLDAFTLATLYGPERQGFNAEQLAVSPDGTRLYVADDQIAMHTFDVTAMPPVQIGQPVGEVFGEWPNFLAITPDGSLVLLGDGGGPVRPYRTSSDRDQPLEVLPPVDTGHDGLGSGDSAALTSDGSQLLRLIRMSPTPLAGVDVESLALVAGTPANLTVGADAIAPVAVDGSVFVYGQGGGSQTVFGVHRLAPNPPFAVQASFGAGTLPIAAALPSADGRVLYVVVSVATGAGGTLRSLTLDGLTPVPAPQVACDPPDVMTGSPDGTRLYGMSDGWVSLLTPTGYVEAS